MILVDTSAWIDADKKPDSREGRELVRLMAGYEVATTGLVVAELLQGATSDSQFADLASKLSALDYYDANKETWLRAAELSYQLKKRGMITPLSDLVIAAVALENNLPVYATDNHFSRVPGLVRHEARV